MGMTLSTTPPRTPTNALFAASRRQTWRDGWGRRLLRSQVLVDCRIAVARHQCNHRAEGQQAGWDVVQDPVFVAAAAESHAGQRGVERRGAGRGDQLRHAAEQVAGLVAGVEHPPACRGVGRDDRREDEDRLLEPALGVLVLVLRSR